MNLLSKLPGKVTRALGKLWLKTKGASPEICVVGGIICGGAALVMVGVNTWKNKDILEKDVKELSNAKTRSTIIEAKGENEEDSITSVEIVKLDRKNMTPEERKILLAKRIDFGKDILKTYWVPCVLGASSIGMIWGGRTILRKELSASTAAYAALLETYNRYRKRIQEEIGVERENEIAYGYKMEEHVDPETKTVEKKVVVDLTANLSQYGFWFNEGYFDKESGEWAWRNFTWDQNNWQNILKVKELEEKYTRNLRTIGYAWLEDVALDFGIDPDEAKKFHDIGWIWKEGSENRVEFGVLETKWQLPVNKAFADTRFSQNECYINPNVDGYIGYVRDDYRKYDMRYSFGKKKPVSMNRKMNGLLQRYHKEQMERLVGDRP